MDKTKAAKKLIQKHQDHADKNGFRLNPDEQIVKRLISSFLSIEEKYGFKYCPCRRLTKDRKKDEKIICPCIYHKKEIQEQGHCHCFLFVEK